MQQIIESRSHRYIDQLDRRSQQMIEEQVPLDIVVVSRPGQEEMAVQPELIARRGGLSAVVRLHAGAPDKHVGALPLRLGQQELVVTRLVAAHHHPGAVVPLHENPRPLQTTREACDLLERRRQMRQRDARQSLGGLA